MAATEEEKKAWIGMKVEVLWQQYRADTEPPGDLLELVKAVYEAGVYDGANQIIESIEKGELTPCRIARM